jgi:ATP-dependent Lon protease
MKKKDKSIAQQFETFLQAAVNTKPETELTVESVLEELKKIAEELGLELENEKVLDEYFKKNNHKGLPDKIADEIFPIYTSQFEEIYGVRLDGKGKTTHIKRTKDGDYKSV